jgi:hypothetical protein
VFRRRKGEDADEAVDDGTAPGDVHVDEGADTDDRPATARPTPSATTGPYDLADAPGEGEVPRIDLGGVHVPVPEGVELRVEVDEQSGAVTSAVIVHGNSVLQVGAYAAPRTEGIWSEVMDEIVAGIREAGGSVEPVTGPFGRELRATVPVEVPGEPRTMQPARFLGVDGPRWFLRGLLQGPAAHDPTSARIFEDVFGGIVVVRGGEAMAPRDALPLQVPKEAMAAHPEHVEPTDEADAGESAPYTNPDFDPFERGPEITELR